MDRREEILKSETSKCGYAKFELFLAWDGPAERVVKNAMDEYMKECCLELLEYMAKNSVTCLYYDDNGHFTFNGEVITKQHLFENFL